MKIEMREELDSNTTPLLVTAQSSTTSTSASTSTEENSGRPTAGMAAAADVVAEAVIPMTSAALTSTSVSNSASSSTSSPNLERNMTTLESTLRTAAKLIMILFGLLVLLVVFLWPTIVGVVAGKNSVCQTNGVGVFFATLGAQTLHILLLIYTDPYLWLHRFLALPIRIPLMPLLNVCVQSEATREGALVWYNDCRQLPLSVPRVVGTNGNRSNTNSNEDLDDNTVSLLTTILRCLKASARRDLKRKLRLYHQRGVTTTTTHSNHLSLRNDIPVIWGHQIKSLRQRTRQQQRYRQQQQQQPSNSDRHATGLDDDDSTTKVSFIDLLDAFLSRFLCIFLIPSAYLDRYYDSDGRLVAMGMFVACHRTLINHMYFSIDDPIVSTSGIWQYNHIRGLLRACVAHSISNEEEATGIDYINFFHHQDFAKQLAGAQPANANDHDLMGDLFPFALYREPPSCAIKVQINLESLFATSVTSVPIASRIATTNND